MVDHKRETLKAKEVVLLGGALGGATLAFSGCIILLAAALCARTDYPDINQDIPFSAIFNLDTVTGKLGTSGIIIIGAGIALMVAGLIYAVAKLSNSSTVGKAEESGNQNPSSDALLIQNIG